MPPVGPISDRDAVEVFHLALLAGLGAAADKRPLVVKGGANLRFFFGSPRYSEDMDFDVTAGFASHQVSERVDIEQIPSSIYVASLARAQEIRTTVGTYSIHRLTPELFGGFEIKEPSGVKLATAEKAIFDLAYFLSVRSRRFAAVPGLHLPSRFRWSVVGEWVARVEAPAVATRVRRRVEELRK